jgi:hypothetical protein
MTARIGLTPEQSANSFTDEELEGMSYGNNPQSIAYRELLAFRRSAVPGGAMVELLRDSSAQLTLFALKIESEWGTGRSWGELVADNDRDTELPLRIDAALAGKVPAPVEVWRMMVGDWRDELVSIHGPEGHIASGLTVAQARAIINAHGGVEITGMAAAPKPKAPHR